MATTLQCQIKNSSNSHRTIENILTPENTQKLLLENVVDIITYLIKTIADEAVFETQFNLPYKLLKGQGDDTVSNFKEILLLIQVMIV